jgi:hypothetical protein
MCIDFTDLNKCCPNDDFPLARIDQIVGSATIWHILLLYGMPVSAPHFLSAVVAFEEFLLFCQGWPLCP